MQLTQADVRELGQLADRWLAASEAERDALRAQAASRGGAFAEAFTAMVEQLASEHDHAVLTPIPASMRDAALSASIEQSKARSAAGEDDNTFRFDSVFGRNTAFGRTLTPPERAAGQRIGPYRLIKELGRGGMGVVWLAERADGQHTRQVALKMPLVENLNWLLAARFARERNILASLEHPGIARLYDAGVDNHHHSTQPYIAIEYVQGQPITTYVKEKKLKPEATVQLFTKVIEAVAHAHTQLIIHRDIKPSNILVDAKGEPHLLDFGIAKLLDDEDSNAVDATQLTKLSGRALTLDYASPEQVNNASLGTASDVYSLGVVLYELLTGTRPYHPKGPTRRDLEQAILDQDPQKPSDQLLTQTTGNSETGKSARRMRGDLDTIVLKALRKDPKQRYATAQAFAEDLKRYIGFEPIAARPQGVLYRLSRYARRHRLALTATIVSVVALVGVGTYALRQQQQADASQSRAQAVDSLLRHLFRGMSPDVVATRTFTANELLDRTAKFVDADPLLDATTRRWTNRTMADLYNTIGEYDKAIKRYSDERTDAEQSGDVPRQIRAVVKLTETTTSAGKLEIAEQYLVALARLTASGRGIAVDDAAQLSFHKGRVALFRARYAEAATHFGEAARLCPAESPCVGSPGLLADALQGEGAALSQIGKYRDAMERVESARRIFRSMGEERIVDAIDAESTVAELHIRFGQYERALQMLEPLVVELNNRLGPNHAVTINALKSVAQAALRVGKFERVREATKTIRGEAAHGSPERARIADYFEALVAMHQGDVKSSETPLRRILRELPPDTLRSSGIALNLAELLLRSARSDEAKRILDDVERIGLRELGAQSDRVAITRLLIACWHAQRGELATARRLATDAAAILKRDRGAEHPAFLVASAYGQLFNTGQRTEQDSRDVTLLADTIERDLLWQSGAAELAKWLRSPSERRHWALLPVIL